MLRLLAMAVLFGGVAVGCAGPRYVALDAPTTDAPALSGTLTLTSAASLALRPAQSATIDLRYTNAMGAPGAAAVVTLAIEGVALDSTLVSLTITTDASGQAHAQLVAGMQASHFRVRSSVPGAAPVYVDVGVGTSFGTLRVRAPYAGVRNVVDRIVDVVPGATCAQLRAMPPASGGRTDASPIADITVTALPTTLTYAVLVRAQGTSATEAIGCAGPITPMTDMTTTLDVPLLDVPLVLDGRFALHVTLDAHLAIHDPIALWSASLVAATVARGGDGALLLDGIEAELGRAGATSAATRLHMARSGGALDSSLQAQLDADHSGPTPNVAGLVAEAAVALDTPSVDLTLTLATPMTPTLTTLSLVCVDGRAGSLTIAATGALARPLTVSADPAHQMLSMNAAPIDVPIGALTLAWIDAVAASRAHVHGVMELTQAACASLETFAATSAGQMAFSACNATCRSAACASVLTEMSALRVSGAAELDHRIAGAVFGASVLLRDDGDARADHLAGSLTGLLVDATGVTFGSLSGTLAGTRTAPP